MKGFQLLSIKSPTLITVLFLNSVLVYAGEFEGFYLGANAGVVQGQASIDSNVQINSFMEDFGGYIGHTDSITTSTDTDIFDNSAILAAHLGYGYRFKTLPFYIGAEVFVSGFDTDPTSKTTQSFDSFHGFDIYGGAIDVNSENEIDLKDVEYGIDLRAGFLLTPQTLFYGRVGAAVNEVELSSTADARIKNHTTLNISAPTFANKNSEDVTGLRLGLGIEHYLSERFTISADYIYTDYGDIETTIIADVPNPDGTIMTDGFEETTHADVASQTFLLGANYYLSGNKTSRHKMDFATAQKHFNNAILGLRAGALINNAQVTQNASAGFGDVLTFGGTVTELSFDEDLYAMGNTASIFGGYGGLFGRSPFYLAVEIFFSEISDIGIQATETSSNTHQYFTVDEDFLLVTNSTLSSTVDVKLNSEYGADLRPGFLLSDSLLFYGRIGAAINEIKTSTRNVYTQSDTFSFDPFEEFEMAELNAENEDEDIIGLRLGLGLEYYFRDKFSVTADYIYTDYGDVTVENSTLIKNDPKALFKTETEVDVVTQAIMVGVIYHHF